MTDEQKAVIRQRAAELALNAGYGETPENWLEAAQYIAQFIIDGVVPTNEEDK
jgi:hypothetical protein